MAIGDHIVTFSVAGQPSATFALVSNPGGFFVIVGSNMNEAIDTPPNAYPISIQANWAGGSILQAFVFTFAGSSSDGPMDFSVPGNIGITGALP